MARERDHDDDDDIDEDRPVRRRRRRDDDDDDYDDDDFESGARGSPPPNYLVHSILVTLCCCLIGGIIAIVNAAQVNSKWAAGDRAGALKASANAKLWCIISVVVGLVTNTIAVIIQVMAAKKAGG
jgi:uncharacterized membrane protein